MKKIILLIIFILWVVTPLVNMPSICLPWTQSLAIACDAATEKNPKMPAVLPPPSSANQSAEEILQNYFNALGGLDKILNLKSLSAKCSNELYERDGTVIFLNDGRFRSEEGDLTTVFDGKNYWCKYYGVVAALEEKQISKYKDTNLKTLLLHNLVDPQGKPIMPAVPPLKLESLGTKTSAGKNYLVLTQKDAEGKIKQYYFDPENYLLCKITESAKDKEYGDLENVYQFSDYVEVEGFKFYTKAEGYCLTTGDTVQPPLTYSDFKPNCPIEEALFSKPTSDAPAAQFKDGALSGQILAVSHGGSYITNITENDLKNLTPQDKTKFEVVVKDHVTVHTYITDLETSDLKPGDFILSFNETPTLWVVKAFVGMVSELEAKVGDPIIIRLPQLLPAVLPPKEEVDPSTQPSEKPEKK